MIGIFLAITYTLFFIFLIRRLSFFHTEGISRSALCVAFIIKIVFGIIFWAVYSYHSHYQGRADALLYFDDGKAIYNALFEKPLYYLKILFGSDDPALFHYLQHTGNWSKTYNQGIYNESRTIIRFNALADIFSFGNYHVHTVFICFLSLLGLTGIFKFFLPYFTNKKKELFVILFFIPSILFWGSGVLKEGLIFFAMGMLLYHFHKLLTQKISFGRVLLIGLFTGLFCITKAYLLIILLPALVAHAWIVKTGNRKPAVKYLVVYSSFLALTVLQQKIDVPFLLMDKQRQSIYMSSGGSYLGIPATHRFVYISSKIPTRIIPVAGKPGYCKIAEGVPYVTWHFENYTDSVYVAHSTDTTTYWIYYDLEPAGSKIEIPLLYPSYASILNNALVSFVNTAFRPHIAEAKNPLMLMAALENSFLLLWIFLCLGFASKKIQNPHILYFCLSTVVLLYVLIGLTTPVLGAAVRYKTPALPFLFLIFLLILDKDKLLKKVPFLKKIIA